MGKSFPSAGGAGAPAAASCRGCSLGKGPRVYTPSRSRSSADARPGPHGRVPSPRKEGDGGTQEPQPPSTPLSPRSPGGPEAAGRRASEAGGAGAAPGGEGEGPAAASRRVHMWRGRRAGAGGGDGEPRGRVYISAKFPDGRSLPALSAFPARPAQPHRPGRSFPEKNARRAAGPWSRPEPLRGKRRGAAAASGATGARGLRAAPGETPAAAGEGQGSNAGWGATCGRGRGRPGTSGLRRRRAVGANARPREGRSGGKGPRTAGLRTRAPPAWALRTPGPRGRLGTRCRRSSPEQGLRGYALEPRLHPLARTDGDFWASPGQFLPSNRLAFFAGGIEPIPQLGFPN